jgi:hypothetical protein
MGGICNHNARFVPSCTQLYENGIDGKSSVIKLKLPIRRVMHWNAHMAVGLALRILKVDFLHRNYLPNFPACTRGRCYDHNFLRFSTTFSNKKLAFFSKTNVMIKILHDLALFWFKSAKFLPNCFGEKYLKIHKIDPGSGKKFPVSYDKKSGAYFSITGL